MESEGLTRQFSLFLPTVFLLMQQKRLESLIWERKRAVTAWSVVGRLAEISVQGLVC